jgi:hypothetical protein
LVHNVANWLTHWVVVLVGDLSDDILTTSTCMLSTLPHTLTSTTYYFYNFNYIPSLSSV